MEQITQTNITFSPSYYLQLIPNHNKSLTLNFIIQIRMAIHKDFIVLLAYFLIISTVLQSQDVYANYEEDEGNTEQQAGLLVVIVFVIFALISLFTLIIAPYLTLQPKIVTIGAGAIILLKYICELATYIKFLRFIFITAAIFFDLVGTVLFYYSIIRLTYLICQKHELIHRVGMIMGILVSMFGISIVLGTGLTQITYETLPVWLYLIILASAIVLAEALGFFMLHIKIEPARQQLNEETTQRQNEQVNVQNNQQNNNGGANNNPENQSRPNIVTQSLPQIFRRYTKLYQAMMFCLPISMQLGMAIGFSGQLQQFLIWKTQSEPLSDQMKHDSVTMMLFGAGGVASSIIVGFCTDKFTLKKIGIIVLVFNALSCLTLYLAIYIKYFYTTILVYFFFGMALLGLFTWLAAVCSKKFEGKSESFAAVLQLMVLSYSLYIAVILLFGNKVNNVTIRLCLELASLVLQSIGGIVFIVKINNDPINVDYTIQTNPAVQPQAEGQQNKTEAEREPNDHQPQEIEMQMNPTKPPPIISPEGLL